MYPSNSIFRPVFQTHHNNPTNSPVRDLPFTRNVVPWANHAIVLKRPDADYLIAFQYFDNDNNGYITFDEFKEAFSRVIGTGSESIREYWLVSQGNLRKKLIRFALIECSIRL